MKYEIIKIEVLTAWHHGVILQKGDVVAVSKAIGEYMISNGSAKKVE